MQQFLLRHRWLSLILLLYLVVGFVYSVAVPLGETPDESEHFLYLQYVAQQNGLPVMSPVREENVTLEAHQPPLHYLLGAAAVGWIEMDTANNLPPNPCFSFEPQDPGRKHAFLHRPQEWPPRRGVFQAFQLMRWLSVMLGAGTVALAYVLGRQVSSGDVRVGVAAAAVLAFNPQFLFITASFNNDVLTAFLGAAILAACTVTVHQPRRRNVIALAALVGLGILTKFALLAFWPLALLAVLLSWRRPSDQGGSVAGEQIDFHTTLINLALVIFIPVLVAGWWYWRAFRLHGDPLMWEVTLAAKESIIARVAPFTFSDFLEFVRFHFQSYWMWFGWLNVKPPTWVYGLFALLLGAAGWGLLKMIRRRPLRLDWTALVFSFLAVTAIYASLFQYIQTVNWTGYQGRLAFAAAAPIAVFLALGIVTLGGARLMSLSAAGLFLVSVAALPLLILPAYPRPEIYQPAPELTRTCARFDSGLQVEAVNVASRVRPGESLHVSVYGYGLAAPSGPQPLSVRLVGRAGAPVGRAVTELDWLAGQVVSRTLALPVPGDVMPAKAVLEVGMIAPDGGWQFAASATGRVLTIPLGVDIVKIAPEQPFHPSPQQSVQVNFEDQMALIGYDMYRDQQEVTVILYWQALSDMAHDYTTFVHLLDGSDQLIAQADGQPQDGEYPTTIWDEDEIVADRKTISVPEGLDSTYQLVTGVYLLQTGRRLTLNDVDSNTYPLLLEVSEASRP